MIICKISASRLQKQDAPSPVSSPIVTAPKPQMRHLPFNNIQNINFEGRLSSEIKKPLTKHIESLVAQQRYGANISLSKIVEHLKSNDKVKSGTINFTPKVGEKTVDGFESLSIYFEKNKKSTKLIAFNPKTPDQKVKVRIKNDINTNTDVRLFLQKGKVTAGIDDGKNLMIAQDGKINAKNGSVMLDMGKKDYQPLAIKIPEVKEVLKAGMPLSQMERTYQGKPLVIGVKRGVAVHEHIAKIEDFLNSKDVVLKTPKKFFEMKQQPMILSGGTGSRFIPGAELTKDGATTLKSLVNTPTGDSPIIDMMKNLHEAGVYDLRGAKVERDIKFVIEDARPGDNFNSTLSAYKGLDKKEDGYCFFPNDAICNMPKGVKKLVEKHNEGNSLVTILMKEMTAKECMNKYGIVSMKDDNIVGFVEKPTAAMIKDLGLKLEDKVTPSIFQFMVSDEAMKINDKLLKNGLETKAGQKIAWSEDLFFPLTTIANHQEPQAMKKACPTLAKVPDEILMECKQIAGSKTVKAVSSNEPWADTGDLGDLRKVSEEIARGELFLSAKTNAHVAKAADTKGLIAQNEAQKNTILKDYNVEGNVMSFDSGPQFSEKALVDAEKVKGRSMSSDGFDYDNFLK